MFSIKIKKKKSFISQRLKKARKLWLASFGASEISSGGNGGSSLIASGTESGLIGSRFSPGNIGQSSPRDTTIVIAANPVATRKPCWRAKVANTTGNRMMG